MAKKDRIGSAGAAPRRRRLVSKPTSRHKSAPPRTVTPPVEEDGSQSPGPDEKTADPGFLVIGIGSSAGGLEACKQLLEGLPANLGCALILVQHMAGDHESLLPELLAKSSRIRVVQARNGMPIEPNQLHVVPPNVQMSVDNGKLRLTRRPQDASRHKPVDFFFHALAGYAQSHAIGVVLSGTDGDGSIGIREIKEAGGITIAQEPESARYDGMPRSAIATGMVDLVLSPARIAEELTRIARHPFVRQSPAAEAEYDGHGFDAHLDRIFALLRNATGVDFTHYKRPTIKRRLQRRMVLHKIPAVEQYVKLLQQNATEVHSLYQDLLIHVTRFFRDPETFQTLLDKVFPRLLESRGAGRPIRVWVPGCSTGEEAYSVAIALLEFLGDEANSVPVQIFATDVSETAIEHARSGLFPESITADVSPERIRRFFSRNERNLTVTKTVRDLCIFARQDLTRDPPFSNLDLILCRNVLIYLGAVLQRKLMNVFHYALRPSGFLMLGPAETIGVHSDLFAIVDKKHKLYSKKTTPLRAEMEFSAMGHSKDRGPVVRQTIPDRRNSTGVQTEANRLVIARYAPPGVIVDGELQIVQFRGQTGAYLEPAPGEASLNLLKMAREGLLFGLRTAIQEARRSNAAVRKEGLRVKYGSTVREVTVEVMPLDASEGRHYLVLFEDEDMAHASKPAPARSKTRGKSAKLPVDKQRQDRLQEELAASREYLQSIIQDLEAANEELQSANEEILSANEELQSTNEELDTAKEELQSTNEELNTVNEELQARNEELSHVNSDLLNLLASVQIAIVMVANDLRIRRFTPMAEKVLNLIPTDLGRPISDIKPNIEIPDLEQLIHDAIETVTTQEREVRDRNGNWYALRVRPYKNLENKIDGAVLALIDIGEARRQQTLTRQAREYAEAVVETVHEPLLVLDEQLKVRRANRAYYQAFHVSPAEMEKRPLAEVNGGLFAGDRVRGELEKMIAGSGVLNGFNVNDGDGKAPVLINARVVRGAPGEQPAAILLAIHNMDGVDCRQ